MKQPIKLYWWKNSPNFGDQLSVDIVSRVSGRDVQWAPKVAADLFAIGSLMEIASSAVSRRSRRGIEGKPMIWGTGCMGPGVSREVRDKLAIASLRGPLSATIMGVEKTVFGDPGLLASECFSHIDPHKKSNSVGIVLHHTQKESKEILDFLEKNPDACLIKAGTNDTNKVLSKIASCETVLSTSLHGLIVADSFGVPNNWLSPRGIHMFYRFKFYDYALSVGRVLAEPRNMSEIESSLKQVESSDKTYLERIPEIADEIRSCFPRELIEPARADEKQHQAANF